MNQVWKEHEKQFIRDHAATMKDRELAQKLSKISGRVVTVQAVRKQRQKLKITKKPGRGICGVVQKKETQSDSIARTVVSRDPVHQPFLGASHHEPSKESIEEGLGIKL